MKIIGPIAGIGSRLKPFTLSKPKPFIRVAGSTVLDHILNSLTQVFDSETELILIVGYKKRQIINHLKRKFDDKFKLTFLEQVPRGYEDNVPYFWGLGESVYLAKKRFKKGSYAAAEENKKNGSLIFLSDMILLDDISYVLYRYYESNIDGIITVMKVPNEDASSYGVVEVDENNFITRLVEKPPEFISDLAIAGIYSFTHEATLALFRHLKKYLDNRTENSKEVYMTESLQDLVDDGFKIAAVNLQKGILDFGRPSEVLTGNRYLLEHHHVEREHFNDLNITFERSYIKNPVFIEKSVKILNSVIGPHVSIGKNSVIENCILENCVIDRDSTLTNIISASSIIGSNVNIENVSKDYLIIGDKSTY